MSFLARLSVFVLSLSFAAAAPLGVVAQTNNVPSAGGTFGDWLLRCADNDASRCALTQRIVNVDTRAVVAEIGIAPLVAGRGGFAMVLNVPEGADLSASPAFRIEGAPEQTAMAWRVCANGTCQASASVTPDEAAAMSAAGRGIFGYKKYRATELTLTAVSYTGLAEGLAAMVGK